VQGLACFARGFENKTWGEECVKRHVGQLILVVHGRDVGLCEGQLYGCASCHSDVLATRRSAFTNYEACRSPPSATCNMSRARQRLKRERKQTRTAVIRYLSISAT
jgi:hypothetical protein